MTYIENIFVCMAAPLLVVVLCMGKHQYRSIIFCIAGMGACLISAYLNTFFAEVCNAEVITSTTEIAPVVEEIVKLLPLIFYLLVFEPKPAEIKNAVILVAASFATFENICYLTQHGAAELPFLLIRGFSTGAMHIVCGAIVGFGLVYVWQRKWLKITGTFGILCAAITFHGIYNLLLSGNSVAQMVAYAMPIFTILLGLAANKMLKKTLPQ